MNDRRLDDHIKKYSGSIIGMNSSIMVIGMNNISRIQNGLVFPLKKSSKTFP